MSNLYPKISGPYMRWTEGPNRNKLDRTRWAKPEFLALASLDWTWTEKIDGTNIRVIWDGYKVTFGGRTDNATTPPTLLKALDAMFPEELLEQTFGVKPTVLYGEGYGAKIQKNGGRYRPDQSFILFDVKIEDWWMLPDDVQGIARTLGIQSAPRNVNRSIFDAIDVVEHGLHSAFGEFFAEGLVGRPPLGITARNGDRLLVKVKHGDFFAGVSA